MEVNDQGMNDTLDGNLIAPFARPEHGAQHHLALRPRWPRLP